MNNSEKTIDIFGVGCAWYLVAAQFKGKEILKILSLVTYKCVRLDSLGKKEKLPKEVENRKNNKNNKSRVRGGRCRKSKYQ